MAGNNNHILIIRFHYAEDDPRFVWRFNYFKWEVLPRILAQTVSDFDIAIRCNPWHNRLFQSLSDRIITFQVKDEYVKYRPPTIHGKVFFYDFIPWENVIGLKKYEIQSGLDSDDLIAPNYMQTIREEIAEHNPKQSLHISFTPEIFNTKTKQTYPISDTYNPQKGSAFMTLYQPDFEKTYHFVYEISHLKLGTLAKRSITLSKGYCWASVHDHNESTGR
jgi:hypothetical protein